MVQLVVLGLGVLVSDDVQAGNLRAGSTDAAQVGCSAGLQIDDCQAVDAVCGGQSGPVHHVGVEVICHGSDHVALHAGVADVGDLQSLSIDAVQLSVSQAVNGHQIAVQVIFLPADNAFLGVLDSVQLAISCSGDGHEVLLGLLQQCDLTGSNVSNVQVHLVLAVASHTVHGTGGVVISHVVDVGEGFAQVGLAQSLEGSGVKDEVLPVGLPVICVVTVAVDLAIDVLLGKQDVVEVVTVTGVSGVVGIQLSPCGQLTVGQVGQDVAVHIVSALQDGDIEGTLNNIVAIDDSIVDGGLASANANDCTILDLSNGLISAGHDQGLVGCVEGVDGDVGSLDAVHQDQHVAGLDGGDGGVGQLIDGLGDGVHTDELEDAALGGIAQLQHVAAVDVDPVDGVAVAVSPQQDVVLVVPAHGLDIGCGAQVAHGNSVGHAGGCVHDVQGAGVVQCVEVTLRVSGQGHQAHDVEHLSQVDQGVGCAGLHVDDADLGLVGVHVGVQTVQQTGGVVVSHINGEGAGDGTDLVDLVVDLVPAVQLAVLGVAVEAAVVAVVVAGDEVDGSCAVQIVVHGSHVNVDHEAEVAVAGVVAVSVEVALNCNDLDGDGLGDAVSGDSDGGVASALCNDLAVDNGSDGLIGGSPGHGLHVVVPGQGSCGDGGDVADLHQQGGLAQDQIGQGGSLFDLEVSLLQAQQADQVQVGLVADQVALVVVAIANVVVVADLEGLGVDDHQLSGVAGVAVLVVSPEQHAVNVGDALLILCGNIIALVILDHQIGLDAISVGDLDGSHSPIVLGGQGIQAVLGVANGVQGAVVVVGNGVGCAGVVADALQLSQLTGHQIHGVQIDVAALLCQDVHGVGAVVESHIHDTSGSGGDVLTIEDAGLQNVQTVVDVGSEDLAAGVLSSTQCSLFQVVVGPDAHVSGAVGTLLALHGSQGDPAVHVVGVDVVVVDTVCEDLIQILAHVGGVIASDGVLNIVACLVAAVVAQDDQELSAQVRDVEVGGPGTILVLDHAGVVGLVVDAVACGVHQNDAGHGHIVLGSDCQVVVAVDLDLLDANQLRSLSINVDGDDHLVLTAQLVIDGCVDGQDDLSAGLQALEVVQTAAVPGVQPGNDLTVAGVVHGLAVVLDGLSVNDLAIDGVGEGQGLCVTQQGQVDLIQAVQSAVAVGGDDVVSGIVDDIAVCVSNCTGVQVEAQNPVLTLDVGPEDVPVLITLGPAVAGVPHGVVVPVSAVEDGSFGPVAVEAQEGQAQLFDDALSVGGSSIDEAFNVAAVLPALVEVCLVLIGQADGDLDISLLTCGDGNGVLVEGDGAGQLGLETSHPVVAVTAFDILGHQSGVQLEGLGLVRGVVDLKGEDVVAGGAVTQGCLGGVAAHGHVNLGVQCLPCIDQTCALLAGRSLQLNTSVGVGSHDGISGAHQHGLSQVTQGAVDGIGVQFLQVLQHQSGDTCNLRSGHGSTGHQTVLAIVQGGVNAAADAGDIGLQRQVGSNAPGGEVGHLASGCIGNHDQLVGDSQGLDSGVSHLLAVFQGNQGDADVGVILVVQQVHAEAVDVAGCVVPDDCADGAGILGIVSLLTEGQGAALDDSDLTLDQAVAVFVIEVLDLAKAVDDDVLGGGASQEVVHQVVALVIGSGIVVADLGAVSQSEVVHGQGSVVSGCDGGGICEDAGGADGGVVGVLSTVQISAPHVVVGADVLVTGGDGSDDVLRVQTLVDHVDLGVLRGETCGGAQGQVDNVSAQGHGVLNCGNDIVGVSTAGLAEDLQDQQLCIGSHTDDGSALGGVCSGDTGNVGAVVALLILAVVSRQIVIAVVEGIGDLLAAVQVCCSQAALASVGVQIFQNIGDVLVSHGSALGSSSEAGMIQVQAGVDDGDLHALAGVTQLVPHISNAGEAGSGRGVGVCNVLGGDSVVNGHDVNALDVLQLSDLFQMLHLSLDGEGVGQVSELITDIQFTALENGLLDLLDDSVLDIQQILLLGSSHLGDRSILLGQRCFLHHHECGDDVIFLDGNCGFLQFLQGGFQLVILGQGDAGSLVRLGCDPGAVGAGNDLRHHAVLIEGLNTSGIPGNQHAVRLRRLVFGDDAGVVLVVQDTILADRHGGDSGRECTDQHADNKQHGQQAFASHKLPPVFNCYRNGKRFPVHLQVFSFRSKKYTTGQYTL